jgi:hypothetical protein
MDIGTALRDLNLAKSRLAPREKDLRERIDRMLDSLGRTPGGHPKFEMSEDYNRQVTEMLTEASARAYSRGKPVVQPRSALEAARTETSTEDAPEDADPDEALEGEATASDEEPAAPEERPDTVPPEEPAKLMADFSWIDPDNDDEHSTVLEVEDLDAAKLMARATAEEWATTVVLTLVGDSWPEDTHRAYRCTDAACRKIEE